MRALHFVSHRRSGGADAMADILARRLPGEGRVVALSDLAVGRSLPQRVLAAPVLLARLVRLLRRERPAAVMTHMPLAALLVSAAALLAGVPRRIVVQHASSDQLSRPAIALDGLFTRWGVFTDVVFVGEAVRASFPSRDGGRARVRVIRNGVELPPVALVPSQRRTTRGGLVVVSVGALEPRKNLGTLVRACARSGAVAELVLLGEGSEREHLARLAADLGQPLRLLGQVSREDVLDALVTADVFAFPTRSEALPLSVVEAAALALPVVASDIAPNREVLADAALYCTPDSVGPWAAALRRLAHDPALRQDLSGRALVRSRDFDLDTMLAGYQELFAGTGVAA